MGRAALLGMFVVAAVMAQCDGSNAKAPGTWLSASKLYEVCQKKSAGCPAYIQGVIDMSSMLEKTVDRESALRGMLTVYCLPEGLSGGDIMDVVVKHIRENPAQRAHAAAEIVTEALIKAFPCQKR